MRFRRKISSTRLLRKVLTQILENRRDFFSSIIDCTPQKSFKGKCDSSTRWLRRHVKDPFVHKAAKDGYRCRSAYKLLEVDNKFNFLTPGSSVVDCGASPGSWTQVALQRVSRSKGLASSTVIAVDLLNIQEIPGAIILSSCDFTEEDTQNKIRENLLHGQADVVMSDMAPKATGIKRLDHSMIIDLNRSALHFAKTILKQGGCFLCKLWDGNETSEFMNEVLDNFSFAKQMNPKASRVDSSELYIFSSGFCKQRL